MAIVLPRPGQHNRSRQGKNEDGYDAQFQSYKAVSLTRS